MIFATRNLTEQSVAPATPATFIPGEAIPEEIRKDKKARQAWYKNPATHHLFYSLMEGANPGQRVSKDNPVRLIHGIAADFDLPVTIERANEYIMSVTHKPQWIERSLGGNLRLIFTFPRPLVVDTNDFAAYLLTAAIDWLALDLLPGLDRPAAEDPMRLYCRGESFIETRAPLVSESALQAFFVEAARKFRFTPPDSALIPLDVVEKALKEKFPNFAWPGVFEPESSGPSFWIADSQSSNSAILKPEGFITFSAHANKPFYNWADLLGPDFVKDVNDGAVAKATRDIFFDGHRFYRKKLGQYTAMEMTELVNFLKIDCGLNPKNKQIDLALSHIYSHQHVENAAPYLFKPPGLIVYMGKRRLNTASTEVMPPAVGTQTWGPQGNFSFLSLLLDNLFTTEIQRDHFLAWWQHFFRSGLDYAPAPGQAIFILGGVGTGKTFTSRELVGRSVGGYADASGYLLRGGEFNSHLFEVALWALDDETVGDSPVAAQNLQAALKKSVANSAFMLNKKFQVAGMTAWSGRTIATSNLDFMSSRILGPIDPSSLGKISVFKAEKISKIAFPKRSEMERFTAEQLPFLLRWLVDWAPPDYVERESRFGYRSYHEPGLLDQAGQTSKAAPFKEILIDTLQTFFTDAPEATEWRGTVTKLIQLLHCNPMNESVIRTLRLEAVARYLESIEREGNLQCRAESGPMNTRIWIFSRLGSTPAAVAAPTLPAQTGPSIFDKSL